MAVQTAAPATTTSSTRRLARAAVPAPTPTRRPAWRGRSRLALAREAPEGTEAAANAVADARMADLMDRLQKRIKAAEACWGVVDACRKST